MGFAGAGEVDRVSLHDPTPALPCYRLMFNHTTGRMLLVYALSNGERDRVIEVLTQALERDALVHAIAARFPLAETVRAHEAVESGSLVGNAAIGLD